MQGTPASQNVGSMKFVNIQARVNPVIVDRKRPQTGISFDVSAADLSGEGCVGQSCLYKISLPLLRTMVLFGKIHYSIGDDGWMKSTFFSWPFAYSLAVLIANFGFLLCYRQESHVAFHELSNGITFSRVLFASMIVFQTSSIFMTVYSWIFEVPSIVRNYNTSAVLEKKLRSVYPMSSLSPKRRETVTIIQIVTFLALFVFDQLLVIIRYKDKPIPMVFFLVFNLTGHQLHSVMWTINNYLMGAIAGKLRQYLDQTLRNGTGGAQSINTCRKAWMALWELSQHQSSSFSTTMICCLTGYSAVFVTSAYGLIVSAKNGDVEEILGAIPYFVSSGAMVAAIVETAHHAKNKLGDEFLDELLNTDKDSIDHECVEEVENFINLILRTDKAQFTLKGYLTVGRPLFVSFLSTTVTYLIVLLQFQQSEEHTQVETQRAMVDT